ncbi:MAG: prepilin-type N-terminal cleavage/methylation domain-containing protein [bacterium]|nr:prepilin-type N-terminal cleavage/methylation domain-containing protein [bacterium]
MTKTKGFTIIELMIVVVIIGILTSIAIPNFIHLTHKARAASVISNMHTTQVTVEIKASDSGTIQYFPNIDGFISSLPMNFKNPYSTASSAIQNEDEANIEGVVEYSGDASTYLITGYAKDTDSTLMELTPAVHAF